MSGKGFIARRKHKNEVKELLKKIDTVYGAEAFDICAEHSLGCIAHSSAVRCVWYGLAIYLEMEGYFGDMRDQAWEQPGDHPDPS